MNRIVAGYLAFIGGYVNSAGLVLLGLFTSHVTGNVGRTSIAFARASSADGLSALELVATFFAGAFAASIILERGRAGSSSRRYGIALLLEAAALFAFAFGNLGASLLCFAMGAQNSLVTRLSGAIVRTTHLTGVVTDLGIEAALWLRWSRDHERHDRPSTAKAALLGTIFCAFALGAGAGGILADHAARIAIAVPALALAGVGIYALTRMPKLPPLVPTVRAPAMSEDSLERVRDDAGVG